MKNLSFSLALLLIISCGKDKSSILKNDHFSKCNDILGSNCNGFEGEYCLFGYKWEKNESFSSAGIDVTGPRESGGRVSFSFQENNGFVHTTKRSMSKVNRSPCI